MLDKRGQVVMSRRTVGDGRMRRLLRTGGLFSSSAGGCPADGLGSGVPAAGSGREALCGGLNHLFPSDGSEGRSAEDSVLIPLAPPCFAVLRGDARASHVTPATAAGARGAPAPRSSPVCVLVCWVFFSPSDVYSGLFILQGARGALRANYFPSRHR
ncbi:unnamed protein product [Rangifer tarandus platyrhynchus]|uniref:Uncharacterized protein n=2 Tax=Rangifer tarandus platyrhynchus TaxID=3082113 RepID=A0ABN8YTN9_RANTA|nr:unnamed protein product [Rangifer tarandus platyrhynchus]